MPKFKSGDLIIYKSKIDIDYYVVTGIFEYNKQKRYELKQFGYAKYSEPVVNIDKDFIKVGEITDKDILKE